MASFASQLGRLLRSPDLRILSIMLVGIAAFGVVDGSLWKTLLSPTIAYRPAVLFGLTLVFGWRGFVWSQLLFLASFGAFLGWRGAVFVTPLFLLSHAIGLVVAQRLARNQPWFSGERSTLGFLAGAALAPLIPALLGSPVLPFVGIKVGPAVPAALDSWLRGVSGILVLAPVLLVYGAGPLRGWVGLAADQESPEPITTRNLLTLSLEMAGWTATLWSSVYFKQRYGINVIYLAFLAPLSFTLFRSIGSATLALITNTVIATTLWKQLPWGDALSAVDLHLLIAICSITVLVLATVVEERKRSKGEVAQMVQAEAALRTSEERFRLAIKATNDAIWDIDMKTGTVSWNETYSRLFGRSPETSDSWQWWIDAIHPEDRDRTTSDLRAAIANGALSWTSEYRFRRLNGEWAYICDRAYIARDDSGNARRVIGAMQDLSQQKQAEAALRESEERFRRVFEEGPLGIALVGNDDRFLKVNQALCRMLGYTEAELTRMRSIDVTHQDDLTGGVAPRDRLFRGEVHSVRLQKRYVKKTGETIWANLTASLQRDRGGEPLYVLSIIEDITEVKRTQEEAFARQKLESLGVLANGIAHDFNNLMAAVLAQAELAMDEAMAGSPPQEQLEQIREVAIRGSDIVRQLMVYAGQEDDVLEPVDISGVIREMLNLLKVMVSSHASLVMELGDDLPAVNARAAQLRQIVMNLVANASDAIEGSDGVIRVSTRLVSVGRDIQWEASDSVASGDYILVEVSDTGRGMSPETQAKIFDPFFTTKSPGHGLGLAVVYGIVRSLNGATHVESEPGLGTTFQILLPSVRSDVSAKTGKTAFTHDSNKLAGHATVLVVEDEDALRLALNKMLANEGFKVLEAANGAYAIELLRADAAKIDLLLLDLTIPGATSAEVLAQALQARPDLKIVVTSAYSENVVRSTLREFRIQSFVRKPVKFAVLVEALRKALASPNEIDS